MFPRPPIPFKYDLNVDQWKAIMRNVAESKDFDAYAMYKRIANSKSDKVILDLYYTREEFNAEYSTQYSILFPKGNKRKR